MTHPKVTDDAIEMVDRIRDILINDYDAPEDKITIDVTFCADGDFTVVGKSGVPGSEEYIEALDAYTEKKRHIVRYHDMRDEGILYRKHVQARDYEHEIYPPESLE